MNQSSNVPERNPIDRVYHRQNNAIRFATAMLQQKDRLIEQLTNTCQILTNALEQKETTSNELNIGN